MAQAGFGLTSGSTGFLKREAVQINPATGSRSCEFSLEEAETSTEKVEMKLNDLSQDSLIPGICEHGFEQIDLNRVPGLVPRKCSKSQTARTVYCVPYTETNANTSSTVLDEINADKKLTPEKVSGRIQLLFRCNKFVSTM